MTWKKHTLTTSEASRRVAFSGRGSLYVEGVFGGGNVQVKIVYTDPASNVKSVTTGYLDDQIDGTIVKTKDLPAGEYELALVGSTGATIDVYVNAQKELVIA